MTGLSRCGRQYPSFEVAYAAAEARSYKTGRKHEVWGCKWGEHWHVIEASKSPNAQQRPDPFPPPVRKLLAERDECCQRCGFMGRLEAHHRRAKASGGSSARAHTQCACNGVLLCRFCHDLVHRNPRWARSEGWIVLQSVSRPGTIGISPGDVFRPVPPYPTCEGGWSDHA